MFLCGDVPTVFREVEGRVGFTPSPSQSVSLLYREMRPDIDASPMLRGGTGETDRDEPPHLPGHGIPLFDRNSRLANFEDKHGQAGMPLYIRLAL